MPHSAAKLTLLDLDDALIAWTFSLLEPRDLGVLSCVDSRMRSMHGIQGGGVLRSFECGA